MNTALDLSHLQNYLLYFQEKSVGCIFARLKLLFVLIPSVNLQGENEMFFLAMALPGFRLTPPVNRCGFKTL